MAFTQNDNSGSLFPNDRKEQANHPDAKGSAMIDGVEYWISGWNKKTPEGKQWRSLSFQRKDAQQGQGPAQRPQPPARSQAPRQAPARASSGFDDDLDPPF
jgi:hypothetical protein